MLYSAALDNAFVNAISIEGNIKVQTRLYTNTFAAGDPINLAAFVEPTYPGYKAEQSDLFGSWVQVMAGETVSKSSRVHFKMTAASQLKNIKGFYQMCSTPTTGDTLLFASDFAYTLTMEDQRDEIYLNVISSLVPTMNPTFSGATFSTGFDAYGLRKRGRAYTFRGKERNLLKRMLADIDRFTSRDLSLANQNLRSIRSSLSFRHANDVDLGNALVTLAGRIDSLLRA